MKLEDFDTRKDWVLCREEVLKVTDKLLKVIDDTFKAIEGDLNEMDDGEGRDGKK